MNHSTVTDIMGGYLHGMYMGRLTKYVKYVHANLLH